jgi:hypothetical protein
MTMKTIERTFKTLTLAVMAMILSLEQAPEGLARQTQRTATMNVSLEWDMQLVDSGKRLRVEYTVTNRSPERLYLCDQLVVEERDGAHLREHASIVVNGSNPQQALFVRGRLRDDPPSAYVYNPSARAFDPNERLTGLIELELPLKAWHNFGYVDPLRDTPKTAQLELSLVSGEARWEQVKLADGKVLIRPQPPTRLENVSSDVKPIPQP